MHCLKLSLKKRRQGAQVGYTGWVPGELIVSSRHGASRDAAGEGDVGPSPLTAAAVLCRMNTAAWATQLPLLLPETLGSVPLPKKELTVLGATYKAPHTPSRPGIRSPLYF